MPTDPAAAEHRRRADELRRYASHLEATPVDEMLRRAGAHTWISPRAEELGGELRTDRGRLLAVVDDLRRHAHWLDAQATALDAAAQLATVAQRGVR